MTNVGRPVKGLVDVQILFLLEYLVTDVAFDRIARRGFGDRSLLRFQFRCFSSALLLLSFGHRYLFAVRSPMFDQR